MKPAKRQALLFFLLFVCGRVRPQPAQEPQTFCNPLNLNYRFMVDAVDAREAADPVIVLFKDEYYLFASRSGGYWVSPDLRTWTLIIPKGIDIESYAPAAIAMRDSLFYLPSGAGQIYKTADPKSGIWQKGPTIKNYGDPAFFLDDDGRLYLSYGVSNTAPIGIVEVDPYTFQEKGSPVNVVYAKAKVHGWERRGDDNLLDEQPWIEGSWLIKHKGKYYLHYAGPGTEFKTYADGIYIADSPLGPYQYAPYSPFSFKPSGFITGAGHGCTFRDKDGRWWRIVTMTISVKHMFERRLGLFPVDFDRDGHIRCNTAFGDYPQFLPGVKERPIDENFSGMLLLSHKKKVLVSSAVVGHGAELAVDEEVRTYWSAATGNADEWLMIDLGKACSIEAVQVNFAEHNTIPEQVRGRANPVYQQYVLEKSADGITWEMLVDKSSNRQDVPHDYIELAQPVAARYIKLTNVFTPGGGTFAVRDLRIFGNSQQAVFTRVGNVMVERNPADGRDAVIRWTPVERAEGYIVRYGIAPDKLYNHYMVYDADSLAIHSLNHGVTYYFEVEAFDAGVENYEPIGEFRSIRSGFWNDVDTWARYDGAAWVHPAPHVPSPADGPVVIGAGHTVTVNKDAAVAQLTVAADAVLVIEKSATLHVENTLGIDLNVEGTLLNRGLITQNDAAAVTFVNEGRYIHDQDGGRLPTAAWLPNSSCIISGVINAPPTNLNQNFFHFEWNCPGQTADIDLAWTGNRIAGNLIVKHTGIGRLQICAPPAGGAAEVTIAGDVLQRGGRFTAVGSDLSQTTVIIRHLGNLEVTGGEFALSCSSQGGNGSTNWFLHGNASFKDAATQNKNAQARLIFARKGGRQKLTLSNVSYGDGGLPAAVDSSATLDIGTSVLQGNGSFLLLPGGTLITAHPQGIDGSIAVTGTKILSSAAGYGFNGASAQVTGLLMPDFVDYLMIDNGQGVTLSRSVQINGVLELVNGSLKTGNHRLAYGSRAALKYSGTSAQTTGDTEFPSTGGPADLIIANAKKVTLHASRTVEHLYLAGKLELGSRTLTARAAASNDVRAFVVTADGGVLKLLSVGAAQALFPVGTTAYAPVWISNSGTPDDISVTAVTDNTPAPFGGRVKIKWNITEDKPGDGNYHLQFGWTTQETPDFRADREKNAAIFCLTDTTEAGSGEYVGQFDTQPYTIARGGIKRLGPFAVGLFRKITAIDQGEYVAPATCLLRQNYPNPFNPSTNISFAVTQAGAVKIIVFDLLGKEVATLIDRRVEAGEHAVQWTPKELPSGVYVYRMTTQNQTLTKKMMLLK